MAWDPQVDTHFTTAGWSDQPSSINFEYEPSIICHLLLSHGVQVDVHELVEGEERRRRLAKLVQPLPEGALVDLDHLDDVRHAPVEVVHAAGDQQGCSAEAYVEKSTRFQL